jgi:GH25 family lysozyme M1 (1,4-beta-N-acetylmuramidase)
MRSFTENEQAVIRQLAVWRQGKPAPMEDFLVENVFTEQSPLAVIIQTQRHYAVLYHVPPKAQERPRQTDRQFFELLALLAYLRGNGYITLYGSSRQTDRKSLYYLHASFDNPRIEANTIYLNDAGDFTNHPEIILGKNHHMRFKGTLLDGDLYDLVLNNMTGILCVSQGLLELLAIPAPEKESGATPPPALPVKDVRRFNGYRAAATAAILCALLAIFGYAGFLANATIKSVATAVDSLRSQQEELIKRIPIPQQNPGNKETSSSITEYYGVDISRWNGDFSREIDQIPRLSFAISKATEGLTLRDAQFANNRKLLRDRGITHGGYHLFRQDDDPIAQVNFYLATMGSIAEDEIAPVVDVENASLSQHETTDPAPLQVNLLTMLRTLEAKTGRSPILYTDLAFAQKYLGSADFAHYRLWLAEYTSGQPPRVPDAWRASGYFVWQKSASYKVGSSEFDLDIYRGDKAALIR